MDSGLLLPTTKHRRGRRTARQEAALAASSPYLVALGGIPALVASVDSPVLDIGFGTGEAVVEYAVSDPGRCVIAVDMHTPGIGDLLASISERELRNVYVVDADVRLVLSCLPERSLGGVRTFFPDPWPKKRHHRRRLIQPRFASDVAARVQSGAFWHIATDWEDYATAIEEAVAESGVWSGGRIPRPESRPLTRYERRGIAAGRQPVDLLYVRS